MSKIFLLTLSGKRPHVTTFFTSMFVLLIKIFGSLTGHHRPVPRFLHLKIPMTRMMAIGSLLLDYN